MYIAFFKDRKDAGEKLAEHLSQYSEQKNVIILALPRGGIVTAYQIAETLKLPLDVIVPRKIGAPSNPELAIGAICKNEKVLDQELIQGLGVTEDQVQAIIESEKKEAIRRSQIYHKNRSPLKLENKTVILVDDGIATGSTMKATIKAVKSEKPQKIVVAIPVAPPPTLENLKKEVDEVVCLHSPEFFMAIGQFYEEFEPTEDQEVIDLLTKTSTEEN